MESLHLLIALAWRNLWRNKRRTLVILFAIVLGVWAMIFTAAFMRGMSLQIIEDTIENLTGHIQIHAQGYLDDPVVEHTFPVDDSLNTSLQNDAIQQLSLRLRVPAVVASERDSYGLVLIGIDPEAEAELSFIAKKIVQGSYLSASDDQGVIIGKKLAEQLETRLGKRVVLMSQNRDNDIADRGFRIVGIFDTQMEALETGYVFIGRKTAEQLLAVDHQVSEIAIRLKDGMDIASVVQQLKQQQPQLDIQAWDELQPMSKAMVEIYGDFHLIWHLIVFMAMGFGIINTLLMAVFERTREFGLFQALGLKPRFIMGQVWIEAMMLLLLGAALGNLVSWLSVLATGEGIDVSAFAQGMEMANLSNIIPFVIVQGDLILANSVVIILGLLTSLYPAWRASSMVPADALTRI
ncbi:MAG: ABC transporter permease [Gammaproteobacteria bacterium]|nr:ABC transporter permease [Gammaproteobacteria bacterium]